MPYEAAELYRNMAEESIKRSNRNAYRTAKCYFKAMYQLYLSLKRENEFMQYMDTIKSANKRKRALLEELSHLYWNGRRSIIVRYRRANQPYLNNKYSQAKGIVVKGIIQRIVNRAIIQSGISI